MTCPPDFITSCARTMRRPSNRPLIIALSACTSPLQEPALPRMNFRHSIRPLSTIPSATSVSHDLSSPDNTISGPRKTSRARFLLRRGLLLPVLVPPNSHHLARPMGVVLDQNSMFRAARKWQGIVNKPYRTAMHLQHRR